MPLSAVDLVQFFLWQSSGAAFGDEADTDQEMTDAVVAGPSVAAGGAG